jgi:hypothetical protein
MKVDTEWNGANIIENICQLSSIEFNTRVLRFLKILLISILIILLSILTWFYS